MIFPKLVRTRHLMSAQREVYEARDGASAMTWETLAGGVLPRLDTSFFSCSSCREHTRRTPLLTLNPHIY